jgi:hypothetical protein
VHSRYAGSFKGAIIADVAMLARNPTNEQKISQFSFDPILSDVKLVFPALKTTILEINE